MAWSTPNTKLHQSKFWPTWHSVDSITDRQTSKIVNRAPRGTRPRIRTHTVDHMMHADVDADLDKVFLFNGSYQKKVKCSAMAPCNGMLPAAFADAPQPRLRLPLSLLAGATTRKATST